MSNTYYVEVGGSGGEGLKTYSILADLPSIGNTIGDVASVANADGMGNPGVFQWNGSNWNSVADGQIPAVDSVNGQTGIVVLDLSDLTFTDAIKAPTGTLTDPPSYGFTGGDNDTGIYSTGDGNVSIMANGTLKAEFNQNDIQLYSGSGVTVNSELTITGNISAANYPPTGNTNTVAGFDGSGDLQSIPGFAVYTDTKGLNISLDQAVTDTAENLNVHTFYTGLLPTEDSPNKAYTGLNVSANIDPNSSGFEIGTNGDTYTGINSNLNHQGTSDIGRIAMINANYQIGNGTDPITMIGAAHAYGFGGIADNVTIDGQLQGWGFQPNVASGATGTTNFFARAFYDNANIQIPIHGYESVSLNPQIDAIQNNANFNGVNVNPNITTLEGNAGFNGIAIGSNIGTIESGGFNGINVNPNVTLNKGNATGLNVSMNNVTNDPGVKASLIVQDITYQLNSPGVNGNGITVEYLNTTTAGNEVASLSGGQHIQVTIESGVSTATQVLAALAANFTITSNLITTLTGIGSNTQTTFAETSLAGGVNPGTKKAAQFDGDVSINGALSFTGGLSIGSLNSFAPQDIATLPSGVASIDTLITQPTIAANQTKSGTDLLAINTAMLLTLGDNATVSSSFLGYAALGLPAVLSMGTGSTIDSVSGAVFAISLDAGATGGTADTVNLCRALAIPNGVTTINKLRGYEFDLPFGDPGTVTHAFHAASGHNYMAGDIKVGDGSDVPVNSSVGIELESTTKAILMSRMTTTEKLALTVVAGMLVFDTTLNQLSYYNGTTWVNV